MQMKTRRYVLGVGAAAAPALLAACGAATGGGGAGEKPATTSGPATLYWSAWGGGERVDQYRSQAERFTKANPNIKVEFVAQGSGDYNEQIISMLASNTQLDVSRLDGYFIASYVARKQLLQLDPIMNADKTFKKGDYLDGVFLENHQVFDGKIYALPNGDSPRVVYYNTAVWKNAGAPDPNELEAKGQWTWEAYLTALKQIAKPGATKVWGVPAPLSTSPELWPWIRMSGGRVLSQDLNTVQIDQPEAVNAL